MRTVSLITWNPEEESYEMSVKHLKVGDDTGKSLIRRCLDYRRSMAFAYGVF